MAKIKTRLTPAQRRAKKAARKEYEIVFINGKQVKIRRPPTVEGIDVDQYIGQNADPLWLHQHGMWELIPADEHSDDTEPSIGPKEVDAV